LVNAGNTKMEMESVNDIEKDKTGKAMKELIVYQEENK
jgi:hypothetical protein